MTIPSPRFTSPERRDALGNITDPAGAVQNANRQNAIDLAAAIGGGRFVDAPDPTGTALAEMDGVCRMAGLNAGWLGLKARARSLNKAIPGHIAGIPGRPEFVERFEANSAELIRAWAYVHALDLIDETAEQHDIAVTLWRWW